MWKIWCDFPTTEFDSLFLRSVSYTPQHPSHIAPRKPDISELVYAKSEFEFYMQQIQWKTSYSGVFRFAWAYPLFLIRTASLWTHYDGFSLLIAEYMPSCFADLCLVTLSFLLTFVFPSSDHFLQKQRGWRARKLIIKKTQVQRQYTRKEHNMHAHYDIQKSNNSNF